MLREGGDPASHGEEAGMPRVRDLLYRFRPAGAPGAATPAAVPVDRAARAAAELAPLFVRLADVLQGCERIRRAGDEDAGAIRDRAAADAARLLAAARAEADAARSAAAAAALARAAAERDEAAAVAQTEALRIRARADATRIEAVRRIVGELEATLDAPSVIPAT